MSDYLLPAFTGAPELDRVYHCDALTLLKALPDNSIDCVITDPPYGVQKATWDDTFPTDWIAEAWRVTSRMLVMTGNSELINAGAAIGNYRDLIIMRSRNGMTRSKIAFGNYIPVLACGDWTWEARPNYLEFNVVLTEKINHPSPKPLGAIDKLISKYTRPEWTIADPFAGSGTTLIAALRNGRRFIGCDVSAEYVEIARQRLAQPYTPDMFALAELAQQQGAD